ncbi:PDR/VanB family oxidoreductase [Nocardia sp. NPDC004860]|uniref:PDR/VanB family oxidoreductase n=1 Tax=Nocardia sp. NPDC004860 TaxID=3154557 RepID=UPI0033AB7D83
MGAKNGSGVRCMRVAAKSEVARDVVAVRLVDPDGREVPAWEPGAHIDLNLAEGLTRQYSLCGAVDSHESLTVAVLREGDGRGGSIWVHDKLEVGDSLEIGGPRNHFALGEASSYLFIAGGIGITPIKPMIAQVVSVGAPWKLLYGGRTRASMAFVDDLQDSYGDKVVIHPQDEFGLLDVVAAVEDVPAGTAVYCCGPEPLLRAVEEATCARPLLSLHVERFSPRQAPADQPSGEFDVELARSGDVVRVRAGESVLDALEQAGVAVEYSCREGTCGTCEVAVVSGTPDHRDSVLTDDERAAGDVMMTCVSRCLGSRLVLDL